MKAREYKALGRLAGSLRRISEDCESDPISHHYGFFPDYTHLMERKVLEEGFSNLHHFYAELQRRTSSRWVYMHMPLFTHDPRKARFQARQERRLSHESH